MPCFFILPPFLEAVGVIIHSAATSLVNSESQKDSLYGSVVSVAFCTCVVIMLLLGNEQPSIDSSSDGEPDGTADDVKPRNHASDDGQQSTDA